MASVSKPRVTRSLLTGFFSQNSPNDSEEQRETKRNLIVSLMTGLGQLIDNPEARKQFGDSVVNEVNVKIETIKTALEVGGDENAEALGKDIGEIAWQVGSIATGVGGAAKGDVALARAGIKVESKSRRWCPVLKKLAGLPILARQALTICTR
jgi:hypothetical protein